MFGVCCGILPKKNMQRRFFDVLQGFRSRPNKIEHTHTWGTQNHQRPCFWYLKTKFFGGENLRLAGAPGNYTSMRLINDLPHLHLPLGMDHFASQWILEVISTAWSNHQPAKYHKQKGLRAPRQTKHEESCVSESYNP